jgi:hypothetical protein
LLDTTGTRLDTNDRLEYERTGAMARSHLGAAAFEVLWDKGRAMTLKQAIAYALEETGGESIRGSAETNVVNLPQ